MISEVHEVTTFNLPSPVETSEISEVHEVTTFTSLLQWEESVLWRSTSHDVQPSFSSEESVLSEVQRGHDVQPSFLQWKRAFIEVTSHDVQPSFSSGSDEISGLPFDHDVQPSFPVEESVLSEVQRSHVRASLTCGSDGSVRNHSVTPLPSHSSGSYGISGSFGDDLAVLASGSAGRRNPSVTTFASNRLWRDGSCRNPFDRDAMPLGGDGLAGGSLVSRYAKTAQWPRRSAEWPGRRRGRFQGLRRGRFRGRR